MAPEVHLEEAEQSSLTKAHDPISSWVLNDRWPAEYFEPDDQAAEELSERDSWLEFMMAQPPIPIVQYVEINGFRYPLPIKKTPSLRRKQSDTSITGSSDQKNREGNSTQYRDPRYPTILETKGIFLSDLDDQVPKTISDTCNQLLAKDQCVPQNSLFRDDLFDRFVRRTRDRNEAMVLRDMTPLIVPSAMNLAIYGDTHLNVLIESVDEAWTGSIPVEGPRPQPDYAVGFGRSAFTDERLDKLSPLVGTVFDTSFFVANFRMYFPFLTCEVKCGVGALDIADRQNANSMAIAVRSVVELFRAVERERELDREVLAFSISHDQESVRIYGHYAATDGDKVQYYRHTIRRFYIDGEEKWTAYKFTKNIYDVWMPTHLKRIWSAIDQLPSGLNFQVLPGVHSEEPSEGVQDELDRIVPQTATPDASVSKGAGKPAAKRAKKGSTK